MSAHESDRIVYWTESLPHGRGQAMRDVVVDGEIVAELSGPCGSPAPIDAVRATERTVILP